jgi:hypothetical protein
MTRGIFDFLQREPSYTRSDKDWYIGLTQSTCFWYDLISNPPEDCDTKQRVTDYLKHLQAEVESQLDKRFIYFLAARKRIRFCVSKKPRYSLFGNKLIFYIEVGRERVQRKVVVKMPDRLPVEVSDRFITFGCTENRKFSMPIHDFLQDARIETGINTEIHYIGYTKEPWKRPIDGNHRGLSDMLYRVSNEDYDFFVFYNLFKVLSIGTDLPINFCLANSMIDEVKVDEEGRIIEKALIKYFNTEVQKVNKKSEEGEFENSLKRLDKRNNIKSIVIHIEMNEPRELYRFFSQNVKPSDKHIFTCRIGNDGVEIVEGSNLAVPML